MSSSMTQRKGRGKAKASLEIIDEAVAILREIEPASVRAVCYRLFALGLIADMSKGSTDKVSKLLVYARENGHIPWGWIVDETREAERIASWSNPEGIIAQAVKQYRKDYWEDQPNRVEIWSEKGTVRGTVAPILLEYGVTFRVMHGYGSATSIYAAAQDTTESDKPLTVFYVGDWDPSGLHMSEVDLPQRLTRYGGAATFTRIALSAQDVAAGTSIPHFDADTKSKDPRHSWFRDRYGSRCWELDALSPVILRQRVKGAILSKLDQRHWDHCRMIEQAERDSMQSIMGAWQASISGQAEKYSGGAQ